MSPLLTPLRIEAGFWLALCGGLAAGIGVETDWGQRWQWPMAAAALAPPDFAKPALAEPFHLPPPDSFLETTLRPIFVVTRRPAPIPPPPEPPKPSMKKDQFVLTGTTIVPEGKFAFLVEKAGNKVRVVSEGKEVNGILVKEISATRVVLTQHDDEEVLMLKPAKGPAQTNQAPGADAPAAPIPTTQAGAPVVPPIGRRPPRPSGAGQPTAPEQAPQP
jgi:hypothetical protein